MSARHGQDGNETVYIGSQKSDKLLRLYDKFRESKKEHYRNCVRFEMQLRHKASNAVWQYMADQGLGVGYLQKLLNWYLEQANIDTSYIPSNWSYVRPPERPVTKEEATIGWWCTGVAPSVARVTAERGWQVAFHALFSQCLTEYDRSAIINAWSVGYGS